MSAEMPKSMEQTHHERPSTLNYNNNENVINLLGKPATKLLMSKTPSPNGSVGQTKIPTPSPGLLRRSTSLRMRGDRFFGSKDGQAYSNNYIKASDSTCNCSNSGKGHVSDPYSFRDPLEAKLRNSEMTSSQNTKLPGTPLSSRRNPHCSSTGTAQQSPTKQPSMSLSLSTAQLSPHTPPVSPDRGFDDQDDDLDSVHSYSSMASSSISCDHNYVARNGTTFSGRKMKYVVHCSSHAGQIGNEYLTPTQRAQRQIRRLKQLLQQAKLDLDQKDSDIFRLTKEVVELRLYKASLNSPDETSSNSDNAVLTVRENTPTSPMIPIAVASSTTLSTSCTDSGHFDLHADKATETDPDRTIEYYERKLEDLARKYETETQQLKSEHNDRVEALLKTLSEVNERYCQLMPDYESAKERIKELEKDLDNLSEQLKEKDEKHKQIYLKLYKEESAANSNQDLVAASSSNVSRVSVVDLLHQLHVTQIELDNIKEICDSADQQAASAQSLLSAKEAVSLWVLGARKAMYRRLVEARNNKSELDPETTLQFLKSAVYYFLTDKENHRGHLRAIESILGFSNDEIRIIDKATAS